MKKFTMPGIVWMGENALQAAEDDICKLGRKALIVTGKSMIRQGYMKMLTDLLEKSQVKWAIFSDIPGEPTDVMVRNGTEIYKKEQCDFLIGFGGGSALDSAKAIAVSATRDADLRDYMGKDINWSLPPIAAIPSTAGTGSEVTQFTIITDVKTNVKMLLKGSSLMPQVAVIDPVFSQNMPENVTVATGLDALTHAVEAYTSRKAYDQSDRYALSAVRRIFRALPKVLADPADLHAREEMSIAAFEAGVSFNNSSVTLVHGMSRPIGALFHVPHGISNAMLLEVCLKFAMPGACERFTDLARTVCVAGPDDADAEAAEKFLSALHELCSVCKVPTLREYGIPENEFKSSIEKMASDAMASGSPQNTRRELTKADIIKLYQALYE